LFTLRRLSPKKVKVKSKTSIWVRFVAMHKMGVTFLGTLDENIKELCTENGVTFTKMCADLGLSRNLLTEIRKGRKKSITGTTARKIADYFGVSVDRVLYGKRDEPDTASGDDSGELAEWLEDLRTRPETKALLSASRGMTKEQVEKMANFITEMKKGWTD